MIGKKLIVVPKGTNLMPDTAPPPALPDAMSGTACSPPARKEAGWPLKAINLGLASSLTRLSLRRASRKPEKAFAETARPKTKLGAADSVAAGENRPVIIVLVRLPAPLTVLP